MSVNTDYKATNFFILRTPTFSFDKYLKLHEDAKNQGGLEVSIRNSFLDEFALEALYLASQELYNQTRKWLDGSVLLGSDREKLLISLYKYLVRMSTRSTPYGLFAGVSRGQIGNTTEVILDSKEKHIKHVHLDTSLISDIVSELLKNSGIRNQISFYPNSSMYEIYDKYRYVEWFFKGNYKVYNISAVDSSEYLRKIFEFASSGKKLGDLASHIVDSDVSYEEALDFINDLIENQLLISELEINLTGEDYLIRFTENIKNLNGTDYYKEIFDNLNSLVYSHAADIKTYSYISELIKLIEGLPLPKELVQVDLQLKTVENKIAEDVILQIKYDASELIEVFGLVKNTKLEEFKHRFFEKYENRFIPLTQALDPEVGIRFIDGNSDNGFAPLINDLLIKAKTEASSSIHWNEFSNFQLEKFLQSIKDKAHVIEITEADLKKFERNKTIPKISDGFTIHGSLLMNLQRDGKPKFDKFLMLNCGGTSSMNLISRFCFDKQILDDILESIKLEEKNNADSIYAEVVHLPQSRIGNILRRPNLREYEIPYLAKSLLADEKQISINDLLLGLVQGELVLWSKKNNKRVFPRLTTAHYYKGSNLPIYNFICELQNQDSGLYLIWDWGMLGEQPFLPRVEYKSIILRRAQWKITEDEVKTYINEGPNNGLSTLRERRQLPRYVNLTNDDNELTLDLDFPISFEIILSSLKNKGKILLTEFLFPNYDFFAKNIYGEVHTHEVIIPIIRESNTQTSDKAIKTSNINNIERSFNIGSEWLYLKIYCGTYTSENILIDKIKPFCDRLVENKQVDKWFFIRYADPNPHIRLRFLKQGSSYFWAEILHNINQIFKELTSQGVINSLQTDTYQREIERYGIDTIELSESIFFLDSVAVLDLISLASEEKGENYRWLFALKGIDNLLDDFNYSLLDKSNLLNRLHESFFAEFNGDKSLKLQLDNKYRADFGKIKSIFFTTGEDEFINEASKILLKRSTAIKETSLKIREIMNDGTGHKTGLDSIVSSYIHMFVNRTFPSNQRKHELVLYYYLYKFYNSQVAISKKLQKAT